MSRTGYAYFDEAYYQRGSERGTAYVNYLEGARKSPIFREIAQALVEVFSPKRVLDVGCATGAIVRWVNELGVEAHGIDVSEWAVANAEHPNVRLASADDIPFPDNSFDLVTSCHALEHVPDAVLESSFKEIVRVSSGHLFHMLPMVGTPPYTGDLETVVRELRKDPTHQQLHTKPWWVEQFSRYGCSKVEHSIFLKNETGTAELSPGQFWMKKRLSALDDSRVLARATARNQRIFRDLQLDLLSHTARTISPDHTGSLVYKGREWQDLERHFSDDQPLDIRDDTLYLALVLDGAPCALRVAVGRDSESEPYADAAEFIFTAKPGLNAFSFGAEQMRILRGKPDFSHIRRLAIGGEAEDAKIICFLTNRHGESIF